MERDIASAGGLRSHREPASVRLPRSRGASLLIVNADDWGLDAEITERTLDCFRAGAVSTVGAMVFMEVSEDAAAKCRAHHMKAGLHINFTTDFTGSAVPAGLRAHQQRVIAYLRRRPIHRAIFNPLLTQSFDYVVRAQIEEFARLYGSAPAHFNGHHHMHLCANMLRQKLLPAGSVVRRSKSFFSGDASLANRCFRELQNRWIRHRYRTTDYFFDLVPLKQDRLMRILALARSCSVEIAVHADNSDEYRFLMSRQWDRYATDVEIARGYQFRNADANEQVDRA